MASDIVGFPRWFLWVVSGTATGFVTLFVPWAAWVSVTLVTMSVRAEIATKVQADVSANTVRIGAIEKAAGVIEARVDGRLTDIERRLAACETHRGIFDRGVPGARAKAEQHVNATN